MFKHMRSIQTNKLPLLTSLLILALGCVLSINASAATAGTEEIRQGVIEQITDVQIATNHHKGIGAVIGAGIGLGVGSLVGGGHGRDVAQVLGTLGGAAAGNEVQKKNQQPVAGQQIIVRVTNGVLVAVTQPATGGLRVGQKVYIEGSGDGAQVIPQ